ncbi:phage integrase SAM-like domain-containing protein [candidate division KSB1 bacterium]|nr:phage integrase SAM-like domain-containing protein [candidate division KSB1 bacterium]
MFWYYQLRIKISTGERIHPKYWNNKKHKAKESKDFPEHQNFNDRLANQERNVMSTVRDHLNENKTILPNKLRVELVNILRPKPETETLNFFQSIQEYIDSTNKAPKTKISYGATQNILKEYSEILKTPLTFDSINMDFYEYFVKYLTETKKFAKNTIGGHIKEIKVFMNYANDKGYTANQGHKHRKFKKVEETAETIYLTDNDLSILSQLDLTNNLKLDRVRDLFIIGCYTGLRFSDLSQLTPDKFTQNDTRLKIKTVKTGEIVVIPLHWTIKEILQKYNGEIPRALSNQKMNEYIKEVAELAKINERITITKTKGGINYSKTFEKHQLVTVHTARRSFATNMFLAEVPTISIMKITGHRTERAFMKYIKITADQNADKLSKHPYFSKSPLAAVK